MKELCNLLHSGSLETKSSNTHRIALKASQPQFPHILFFLKKEDIQDDYKMYYLVRLETQIYLRS